MAEENPATNATQPILDQGYVNSICELQNEKNILLAHGRILSIAPDGIDLVQRDDEITLDLHFGMPVKLNVYNTKRGFKVLTAIVKGYYENIIRLNGVMILQGSERRDFVRVPLVKKGTLTRVSDGQTHFRSIAPPIQVRVENMSLSGLQFSCYERFEMGTCVFVSCQPLEDTIQAEYEIVRMFKDNLDLRHYGCRLIDPQERQVDKLSKTLLRLQLQQRGKRSD